MTPKQQRRTSNVASTVAACVLAVALGGCASMADKPLTDGPARPIGTRMGLPIPPCDTCAPALPSPTARSCTEACLGLCCGS